MGGLPRRATFLRNERAIGPDPLVLDSGNLFSERPLAQAALDPARQKARLIVEIMGALGYKALALGELDLYLGLEELKALAADTTVAFLSANLADARGKPLFETHLVTETGGIRVGVVGVTAPPANLQLFRERFGESQVLDPVEAVRAEVGRIREKCDLVVLLSNLGYSPDVELARTVPGIDIIISGRSRRYMKRPTVEGNVVVTSGYFQGRSVGKLVVHYTGEIKGWVSREELDFLDKQILTTEQKGESTVKDRQLAALARKKDQAQGKTVYEADMVDLGPSFGDDPATAAAIRDYRSQLAREAGLTVSARGPQEGPVHYTGPRACARCHEERHRFWVTTPHARAMETLASRGAEADPDCVGCHVTGYRRPGGFDPSAPREDLNGVQCEACHGVGSLHVEAPDLYSLLHLPAPPQCMDCHTEEQDEDFDFFRDKGKVCGEK